MGLHICYELALPPETTRNRVLELLAELRLEAMRGTFERVTEIRELHAAECEFRPENDTFDLWALFKISARKTV